MPFWPFEANKNGAVENETFAHLLRDTKNRLDHRRKSDTACFVLGERGDAGLLRQDEKTPRVLYNVDTKVLKNQLHIAGAHRRSEFIRMVYREKRPPGTCSLQIRVQQHLGQPDNQRSHNVRLKVPSYQESSPRHRRSSRSSCRRHTDLPSDSHRHQPPGSHR